MSQTPCCKAPSALLSRAEGEFLWADAAEALAHTPLERVCAARCKELAADLGGALVIVSELLRRQGEG